MAVVVLLHSLTRTQVYGTNFMQRYARHLYSTELMADDGPEVEEKTAPAQATTAPLAALAAIKRRVYFDGLPDADAAPDTLDPAADDCLDAPAAAAAAAPAPAPVLKQEIVVFMALHAGWVIEAPVGSNHKIDLAYLSPHVSLVQYLPSLCPVYDTTIVLTDAMRALLSPTLARRCRMIDRLPWPASNKATRLAVNNAASMTTASAVTDLAGPDSSAVNNTAASAALGGLGHSRATAEALVLPATFDLHCFDINRTSLRQRRRAGVRLPFAL